MKKLARSKVLKKIEDAGDAVYSVVFKKKDGTKRTMMAKQGVQHNLKGGVNKVIKDSNDYISTFDVEKFAYRTINLATVERLKIHGTIYKVV
jgi:hypothetical protein